MAIPLDLLFITEDFGFGVLGHFSIMSWNRENSCLDNENPCVKTNALV